MQLSDFILRNIEPILMEWESFARQIWPGAATDLAPATLRDHAEEMLRAAVADMNSHQTAAQRHDKSRGKVDGGAETMNRPSASHGVGRMASGFDLAALIAEYRALRASVVRLWRESGPDPDVNDVDDLTRFNEYIDRSLTEAVLGFTQLIERDRRKAQDKQVDQAQELREMNDALLTSSVRQHELTENAQKAEAAAHESRERYRALFDLGPVAVYACDASGVILDFNHLAVKLWGRKPVIGDTDERYCGSFKMFRPDGSFMPHPVCPMADVVSGKIPSVRDAEVVIERPDGSQSTVVANILPLTNEQGQITGAINCFYDITDRKQAENALDMAREQAESASRAKDRFLAVLSHELRTPLTPVMMSITAMDMNPDLAPEVRNDIAMIRRNMELEAKLIDDLLDLSRVTSGKLRLNMEAVELNSTMHHVYETCRPFILEKGIHLHTDLPHQSPFVKADPARLQQVLWNLLRNAAKFTPERGDIYVSIFRVAAERVQIEVRDTGIGIPAEVLPKIFDAFEQGDANVTRRFGGMGLGLSISKALIEMHQGTIRAQTAGPGLGSTFTVELPLLTPEELAPAGPLSPAHNGGKTRLRVLVVEDHRDTAEVLSRLLRASGYAVKTAHTAAAALELAAAEPFEVIVSDIGLPDKTGYDLMREIKSRYPTKGIAMSGYGMDEDLRRSREAGFSDHIVKPANAAQLERSIRRLAGDV
jgi:signal transduction histidine kinase/CheY-like chemotaxis protein